MRPFFCGVIRMNLPQNILESVQRLLAQGRKIDAIKLVRDATKCDLKEAKDYVEQLEMDQMKVALPSAAPLKNIDGQLLELIRRGKKINAIKLYREHTGEGLAESKDYVDALEKYGISGFQKSGKVFDSTNTYNTKADKVNSRVTGSNTKTTNTAIDRILQEQKVPGNNNGRVVIVLILFIIAVLFAWILLRK